MPESERADDGNATDPERFEPAVDAWLAGLGLVRDAVRQELVRRQLAANLPAADKWKSAQVLVAASRLGKATR